MLRVFHANQHSATGAGDETLDQTLRFLDVASMRCFLALCPPASLKEEISHALRPLRDGLEPARVSRAENVHLTLHFFGRRTAEEMSEWRARLGPVFAARAPLRLELAGAGGFPARRPRVLWLGLVPGPELGLLYEAVRACLIAHGEVLDVRPFAPHLTVARSPRPLPSSQLARLAAATAPLIGRRFTVAAGFLFESRTEPSGARYRELEVLPLAAETAP
jgi:2'-5' RNA ligase